MGDSTAMSWDKLIQDPNFLGNVLMALATVFATALGVYLVRYVNRRIDERKDSFEKEQQILKSLEFLTGGTQSRSAGLGIIEGLLPNAAGDPSTPGLRAVFLPVVRNQLIYLSTTSRQNMEFHEHDNFVRLLLIWRKLKPTPAEVEPLRTALDAHDKQKDRTRGLEFVGDYRRYIDELRASVISAGRSSLPNS